MYVQRFLKREPAATIDFRDFETTPGARRPFDLTCIARQTGRIAITFERPRRHELSALLLDRSQIEEVAGRLKACLFFKLTLGGNERILVWFIFTFRNGPCPLSLLAQRGPPG